MESAGGYVSTGHRRMHCWGIILAGGEGKRLEPYLRSERGLNRPKQFCAIVGRRSMLRHTIDRASTFIKPEHLLTVISRHHVALAMEDLYDRDPKTVLTVPFNCETGASILLALLRIHSEDPEAIVVIFPSDHFILQEARFMDHVRSACSFVSRMPGFIVTLGIVPDSPQSGYGWIEKGEVLARQGATTLFRTKRFWEKPPEELTQSLLNMGCLWNTLTLAGTASKFIRLFSEYTPEMHGSFREIENAIGTLRERQVVYDVFLKLSSVNFSKSILERTALHQAVLPVSGVYWSDWGDERRVRADLGHMAEWNSNTGVPEKPVYAERLIADSDGISLNAPVVDQGANVSVS
jgi:mannose-1-phosphate guanylyltransferase